MDVIAARTGVKETVLYSIEKFQSYVISVPGTRSESDGAQS